MQPYKAQVTNRRIRLDEPTDLPEGEVVYLVPLIDDGLDDEERATLHAELGESLEQMKQGQLIDADNALAELRAHI